MDRFGFLQFVHYFSELHLFFSKSEAGLTDEERAHKLRIETEYRREKKWKSMLDVGFSL